jgi:hypothetical protein
MNDIAYTFYEADKTMWELRVGPTHIRIHAPAKNVNITLGGEAGQKPFEYDEECAYRCGADVVEGYFKADNLTLTIVARVDVDFEDSDEGIPTGEVSAEVYLEGPGWTTRSVIPYTAAKIIQGAGQGLDFDEIKELYL